MLAAAGEPITVLALTEDGPRPARTEGAPFVKGIAELYVVATEDGQVITVTDQHRFLTPQGWLRLADVQAGELLRAVDSEWAMVTGIARAGTGVFYDMHVPGPENYAAEGLWKHNTGKTKAGVTGRSRWPCPSRTSTSASAVPPTMTSAPSASRANRASSPRRSAAASK